MITPDIVATVELARSDQGGRAGPTPPDKFGCVMKLNGHNHDVRLLLDRPLAPGDTRQVGIIFLDPETALSHVGVGATFLLWEGPTIGSGIVEQVVAKQALIAD